MAGASAVSAQMPGMDISGLMGGGPGIAEGRNSPFIFGILSSMVENDPTASKRDKDFARAIYDRAQVDTPPPGMYQAAFDVIMGNGMDRVINCVGDVCSAPISLKPLFGYGCWCNLGNELLEGNGEPQDSYDQFCKMLQHCLRCVQLETSVPPGSCNPSEHEYVTGFVFNPVTMTLVSNCESENIGDDCAVGLCTCEVKWIDNILNNGFSGIGVNGTYSHENGFDRDANCPKGGHGPVEAECCGRYPDRMMYNSLNLECCEANDNHDGSIFNSALQCCADNGPADFGSGECV